MRWGHGLAVADEDVVPMDVEEGVLRNQARSIPEKKRGRQKAGTHLCELRRALRVVVLVHQVRLCKVERQPGFPA